MERSYLTGQSSFHSPLNWIMPKPLTVSLNHVLTLMNEKWYYTRESDSSEKTELHSTSGRWDNLSPLSPRSIAIFAH